jgi:hypothetical protein
MRASLVITVPLWSRPNWLIWAGTRAWSPDRRLVVRLKRSYAGDAADEAG